jgi:hypothetical protein
MQIEAVRLEAEAGRDFALEYPEQFVLAREDGLELPGWDHAKLNGLNLWRAPGARTKRLLDKSGRQFGWLLGEAVDGNGQYLSDPVTVPVPSLSKAGMVKAEAWIEALAGRYAVILAGKTDARIYQDPVGDFSVVWDPETGIIASSVLLALNRPLSWNPRFDRRKVLDGKVHFSLGHTADRSVRLMWPNHYLDLANLRLVRHWPRADTVFEIPQNALEQQVAAISDRLTAVMRALVTGTSCLLPISGGRDSRNLAGVLGPAAASLVAGFAVKFHKMSRIDSEIGGVIAERLGVPYFAVSYKPTSRQDRFGYYRRTGYGDGGAALHVLGSHLTLPPGNLSLRGNVMEIIRANQWNQPSIGRRGMVKTAFGLRRLLIERGPEAGAAVAGFADEYEAWAETLPQEARRSQLDIAFCEQLLPNTLGIRHFGDTANFVMNPFACRQLILLAMQIPAQLRVDGVANKLLLERNCAQFSDVPFESEVASGDWNPASLRPADSSSGANEGASGLASGGAQA